MVGPDIAPVDDPGEQPLVLQAPLLGDELGVVASAVLVNRLIELIPVDQAREVEADTLDRQVAEHAVGVADVIEVGLDHDPRALVHLAELLIREPQRVELLLGAVLDEAGLVELHPGRALLAELLDHLAIDLDQRLEQIERIEVLGDTVGGLGEEQEADRADQRRHRVDPRFLHCLDVLVERLGRGEREFRSRP